MWESYWVAKPKLLPFKAVIIAHVFYTHVLMGIGMRLHILIVSSHNDVWVPLTLLSCSVIMRNEIWQHYYTHRFRPVMLYHDYAEIHCRICFSSTAKLLYLSALLILGSAVITMHWAHIPIPILISVCPTLCLSRVKFMGTNLSQNYNSLICISNNYVLFPRR